MESLKPPAVAVLQPYRQSGRPYDELGLQIPRNPFRGKTGVLLLLRMGMASQFERVVPESHVLRPGAVPVAADRVAVACVCGRTVVLEVGELAECPGSCERWFLRSESSVRVATWPRDEDGEG